MHCVTVPPEPFSAAGGALEVVAIPAADDNLVWVVACTATGEAAIVDGPDAEGALAWIAGRGYRLVAVFNTHTHGDHIGVNLDLQRRGLLAGLRVVGNSQGAVAVPGLTEDVDEGDTVQLGAVTGRVLRTEGHLRGHICFVFGDVLFCGDTMFAGGCGYLFDGPASSMFDSLLRLAELDGATRVCCAHEYTLDNLRFAAWIEPSNAALAERLAHTEAVRATGATVVPSTIALERATNPFLRPGSPELAARVGAELPDLPMGSFGDVFAATRALKNTARHRAAH